jgi:CubicO group peptidase (beta-lactamase class C family)
MKNLIHFPGLPAGALSVLLLFSCASQPAPRAGGAPAVPWPSSSPQAQGMDGARLQQMVEWMRASGREFHSVLIVRGGALVMEEYFPGGGRDVKQNVYSCTKSVLSALCGIAQGEGSFPPLDSGALASLPPGTPAADPRAAGITMRQLLSMSSGLPFMRAVDMATANDQVRFALGKPLALDPGAGFVYTSAGPHLVSAVLQRGVGMSARDYARKKLFQPLGIQDWSWETDGTGVTVGATNLSLTPIDLAKLGFLFLHDGAWFGTRVVPASWVKDSTTAHARVSDMNRAENAGYGWFWWIDEEWNGFSAHGAAGQFVFVVPRLDLVAVFTSGLSPEDFPIPWDLMRQYVLPSVAAAGPAAAP